MVSGYLLPFLPVVDFFIQCFTYQLMLITRYLDCMGHDHGFPSTLYFFCCLYCFFMGVS